MSGRPNPSVQAGIGQPGNDEYSDGENSRSDAQPCCHAPPGDGFARESHSRGAARTRCGAGIPGGRTRLPVADHEHRNGPRRRACTGHVRQPVSPPPRRRPRQRVDRRPRRRSNRSGPPDRVGVHHRERRPAAAAPGGTGGPAGGPGRSQRQELLASLTRNAAADALEEMRAEHVEELLREAGPGRPRPWCSGWNRTRPSTRRGTGRGQTRADPAATARPCRRRPHHVAVVPTRFTSSIMTTRIVDLPPAVRSRKPSTCSAGTSRAPARTCPAWSSWANRTG